MPHRFAQLARFVFALGLFVCASAVAHPRVGGWLEPALRAWHTHDGAGLEEVAAHGRAIIAGDAWTAAWRLQAHLAPGLAAERWNDATLRAFGGRVAQRGIDLVDVWLPLGQVEAWLAQTPEIAMVQLPWRSQEMVGPKLSEGAVQIRAGAQFACLAADGTGTVVAVLDGGFDGLDNSVKSGEVPNLVGPVLSGGGSHGTMCAEVVADMAPGAKILPVAATTFADLQFFIHQITKKGNPNAISLVSHSVIWLGHSFGRHDGKLCQMMDQVREQGVAWVSASGNSGNGEFYKAIWNDADKDTLHEFSPGQTRLQFQQWGGTIQMTMDWDDYDTRTVNLDLYLQRKEGNDWVDVTSSKLKASLYVPPLEQVVVQNAKAGVYGLQVRAVGKVPNGLRLRIVAMGGGNGKFSIWHKNGNVYDPASCDGVLTVGAIYQGHYAKGPLEAYSSYGPTPDKRIKPEVMAPTGVSTSLGAFFGTSAACPHAAGALATWISATGQKPLDAMASLRKAAIPMGEAFPDQAYGWGRVALPPLELGWQCTATDLPAGATCLTGCGSLGSHACTPTCRFTACAPPAEKCNLKDDDCDGATDENLAGCVAPVPKEDVHTTADAPEDNAAGAAEVSAGVPDTGVVADLIGDARTPSLAPPSPGDGGCASGRAPGHLLAPLWCLAMCAAIWRSRCRPAR
ncbi:MAG: S8 family serine peptidase [Deltaproteobacteria bacterium]|nr:S8 family serine peptidase [Deltaproteobacteria bacterium]